MCGSMAQAFAHNFLGHSPRWYKLCIVGFLIINFAVILLLMFMVAGIYLMKDLLLFVFSRLLLGVRSKAILALMFCFCRRFCRRFAAGTGGGGW
ncbi:hypothetical protein IMF27_29740 [Pseudomonas sp. PCH199]|nr:hypothetical protein [Pseudomonas sp. PCH199]